MIKTLKHAGFNLRLFAAFQEVLASKHHFELKSNACLGVEILVIAKRQLGIDFIKKPFA